MKMRQLIHNGVYIPPKPEYIGFTIKFRGKPIKLTPEQEQMAIAWVQKSKTKYAKDGVFVRNFFKDFRKALNLKGRVYPRDFDFSEIEEYLEQQKRKKESLSKEEKAKINAARREQRQKIKEKYGYAIVDGVKMELENYVIEPSGIFMGCAKHPLRGRWKPGATQEDIILNLSPDAPIPPGNWKAIVWNPNVLWIAQWKDKLTRKMKYVWLAHSSPPKQINDIIKFEKAKELDVNLNRVRKVINRCIKAPDPKIRKIATVIYLIDSLCLRVGDEKDPDEADTVGACTLRPENIKIKGNKVIFDFYGKGAVHWHKERLMSQPVIDNLEEFIAEAKSEVFEGINSKMVNKFLGRIMPGLTAKVFRTHHATKTVEEALAAAKVKPDHPDYIKKHALIMANLGAAVVCNHKRAPPKNWKQLLEKRKQRLKQLQGKNTKRAKIARAKLRLKIREMKMVKDYNLRTSLKSYIDPRVIYRWCQQVNYDWRKYYPKTFQRRFSWIENPETVKQWVQNHPYPQEIKQIIQNI